MPKCPISLCLVILMSSARAQNERVYLHLDKYSCRESDTIWFKAYVLKGSVLSSLSTNLYVELFTPGGAPVVGGVFPILQGISIGQIKIPDSITSGNYFLRVFTRYQLNYDTTEFFSVPILVYNRDKPHIAYHKKPVAVTNQATSGIVKNILWTTSLYKGQLSSLLAIDSGGGPRHLQLVKPVLKDSGMIADLTLDENNRQKYCLLPLDTAQTDQLLLLFEDTRLIGRQYLHLSTPQRPALIHTDTLNGAAGGYNSWTVTFPDTTLYSASIAISDADCTSPSPTSICSLDNSRTEDLTRNITQADTGYLTIEGRATRPSGKLIRDEFSRQILLAGARDSNFLFTKVVRMDSAGFFKADSLFFFDSIAVHFQINKQEDGSTKNIHLQINRFVPPAADSDVFSSNWTDDSITIGKKDTFYSQKDSSRYALVKMKTLTTLIVKGWKSPRQELDQRYTSGAFSEPAMYSFDIRTERRYHDIGAYLRAHLPRFLGGFSTSDTPRDAMDHPLLFFVDEQNYTWAELGAIDWDRIAYIKCFENDFIGDDDFIRWKNNMPHGFSLNGAGSLKLPVSKTPMIIAIYLREGKDFRTMPGGLNKITVRGYTSIQQFHPDHSTIFWEPNLVGHTSRIQFYNNEAVKRFRVVLEGIDYQGHLLHLEKVIEPK